MAESNVLQSQFTTAEDVFVDYIHDFNADLGPFTFDRASQCTAIKDDNTLVFVEDDIPAYPGNPHNGTIFVPSGGSFKGILLERGATNYATRGLDQDRNPPWVRFENTTVSGSEPTSLRRSNSGEAMIYQALGGSQLVTEYTVSVDVWSDTNFQDQPYYLSTDGSISHVEVFVAEQSRHRNSARKAFALGEDVYTAVGFTRTSANERLNIDNHQLEIGPNASSFVMTFSSTTTRDDTELAASFEDLGLVSADFKEQCCGQIKFEVDMDTGFTDAAAIFSYSSSGGDYVYCAFLSTGPLYMEFNINGVQTGFVSATVTSVVRGSKVDIRWKLGASEVRVWFNDEEQSGTPSDRNMSGTPGDFHIGGTSDSANIIVERIRLNSRDPGNAVIEGWD